MPRRRKQKNTAVPDKAGPADLSVENDLAKIQNQISILESSKDIAEKLDVHEYLMEVDIEIYQRLDIALVKSIISKLMQSNPFGIDEVVNKFSVFYKVTAQTVSEVGMFNPALKKNILDRIFSIAQTEGHMDPEGIPIIDESISPRG